ncbi:MAG: DUF3846 domain-containing protein [Clostridiales bacterium]|nr:DUF3846 domain-containing protein [Clostridiales bacterium]
MKEYDVTITETLEKTVTVEAESREEAEELVEQNWNDSLYILDADDFSHVDFETKDERSVEREQISVLLVEPEKYPQIIQMENTLEAMQQAVGGDIQATYPFEEPVCIICNEEGKLNGFPLNRALRDEDGQTYDILAGNFLVVGLTEDDFGSLSPEHAEQFEKLFHQPEAFIRLGRSIMAIPIDDEAMRKREKAAEKVVTGKAKTAPEQDVL